MKLQRADRETVDGEEASELAAERLSADADEESARSSPEGEKAELFRRLAGLDNDQRAQLMGQLEGLELGKDRLAKYRLDLGNLAENENLSGWRYGLFREDEELAKALKGVDMDGKRWTLKVIIV